MRQYSLFHRLDRLLAVACLSGATLLLLPATEARAVPVSDPTGDFLASYTGVHNADLDVVSVSAIYDGSVFHLTAVMNGTIGTTTPSLYVFGINRGAGVASFASIGESGVLFDAVVTVTGLGVTAGRLIQPAATSFAMPGGSVHISGSTLTVDLPESLIPSAGFSPDNYDFSFWTRDQSQVIGNAAIADFAPDNGTFRASVPEPPFIALFGLALVAFGIARRKQA